MRKIILEGIRFRFITRKGVCYGKLGDKWAYVHYVSHANGTTYMVDVPKKDVLDVARGRGDGSTGISLNISASTTGGRNRSRWHGGCDFHHRYDYFEEIKGKDVKMWQKFRVLSWKRKSNIWKPS